MMSVLLYLPLVSEGSGYPPSATPRACIIIPDLLLLYTVGEEERDRKRQIFNYRWICAKQGGERHPVTKQLLCQKPGGPHTHAHTLTCKDARTHMHAK